MTKRFEPKYFESGPVPDYTWTDNNISTKDHLEAQSQDSPPSNDQSPEPEPEISSTPAPASTPTPAPVEFVSNDAIVGDWVLTGV